MNQKIIEDVCDYYTEKLQTFGATPKGVDWNSLESQELRFEQLVKIIEPDDVNFSMLDYGCGFGSMFPFVMRKFGESFSFTGYDISEEMIKTAKSIHAQEKIANWVSCLNSDKRVDYVISSGIFNVKLQFSIQEWQEHILEILQQYDNLSKKGFAFNMLTDYSDSQFMRQDLYYGNPSFYFDFCKKHFSKYVSLLHDYPLYEFTILVKKS